MSRTVWIVLGISSIVAAVSLLVQAPDVFATRPPDKQLEFILFLAGLVGLCGTFAVACFFPKSHPITLRIIGAIGVVSCVFSIYSSFQDRSLNWIGVASRLSIVLGFWLPGSIYLLLKGKMTT
ncbi:MULTISPECIES: hypothetical protein [Nostocales]|uniref:Uncharacterized protein n=3 Tax=Nostocales TaxID=1161 RepID=A0A0C1QRX7_9CYAN|nr:hypothetical protein [Tolypothrix bouteillei]KAF3890080.1 hypothetical protein DA73_0400034960 [Tolypothrix bouteillei VB521301]